MFLHREQNTKDSNPPDTFEDSAGTRLDREDIINEPGADRIIIEQIDA
jgi:hypothetical protein